MKEEQTYEQAFKELDSIVRGMEQGELDIDQLAQQLKRAQELIKLCHEKLVKADNEVKQILSNTQ